MFVEFFDYVKALNFQDQPNYELMKNLFLDELKAMKSSTKELDWLNKPTAHKIK